MQREITSGGGSCDGDVKVHEEAGVNEEASAHRGAVMNREATVK